MPSVTETVTIAAPVDRVYSFLADNPEGAVTFIPGLNRIENVSPADAGVGQTWQYEFNWFGVVFAGNSRCTKLDRPRTYEFRTETGNRSTWTYTFPPNGSATKLTLVVDYDLPESMIARFATQGTIEKMNQERAAEALQNLKGLLEE
jgi:carbon monoxide dehydrogenase subunit G